MPKQDITEKFLQTGHFLGLKFDEGWWFVHILETEMDTLKPWILLNENENRAAIAAGTAGTEDNIRNTVGEEIIIPDDDEKDLIFQARVGIAPSRMQLFYVYGRERNNALQSYDEPGDPAPIINGFDSPYNDPAPITEVFPINDMSPLRLQAYNPMDEAEEARLSIHVNKMKYATVTNVDLMNSFLQGQLRARLSPAGRGAQRQDQIRAPGWLQDTFGDHILTTEEIFQQSEGGLQGAGSASEIVSGVNGGTEAG